MRFVVAFFLLLLLLTGCAPSATSNSDNTTVSPKYSNNISTLYGDGGKVTIKQGVKHASDIVWKDSSGVLRHLDSLRGKIIVLNFWATWCKFCLTEMPDLEAVADSLRSQNVV